MLQATSTFTSSCSARAVFTRVLFSVCALLALLASSTLSLAEEGKSAQDRTLSPYFFVEGGDSAADSFPLLSTAVNVAVSGVIADVRVTQTYKNGGKAPINARYVFPASTRAAVHGLSMKLGERLIVAKIKEREKARAEFDAAKKAGKTAALLEEERPNVFSMGVANILPNDQIEVTLDYTELLIPESGTYEFVFPTVVGPRYSNQAAADPKANNRFVESPYLHKGNLGSATFSIQGTVAAGFPISKMGVDTHPVKISWDTPSLARFALDSNQGAANNKDFILHYRLAGDAIQSGLSLYEKNGEKFFLAIVQAPERVKPAEVPAREFVFIVDVSGSMQGFPIDTTKVLLRDLISALRPKDTFNLLFFSGDSKLMAPASLAATRENLDAALRMLEHIDGSGGTELLPALQQALALRSDPARSRSFVVITDGYISAEPEVFEHIRNHLGQANVYSFGIGSSVNRFLVEGVARAGLGVPFVVTDPSQAPAAAKKLREYISAPALTRVRVSFEGLDAYAVEPKAVPDVLADRPVVIHGKWRGEAKGGVVLRGISGAGPYEARLLVKDAKSAPENSALPYLWARTRIGTLSDFAGPELSPSKRQEVVALGLKYNLLTPFTSFIAVNEQVRNPGGNATNVVQPLSLPVGVSELAVGGDVTGADEPELVLLVCAASLALGVLAWRRQSALQVHS